MSKWPTRHLGEVCDVNPKLKPEELPSPDTQVSFIPMAAVDEVFGEIARPEVREYSQVAKGYTPFKDQDVLFAKITPCMENGKAAIADHLIHGIGFGSTEFHVLRPTHEVLPKWIHYFVRQPSFRDAAEANFTGTAGQRRVPTDFMKRVPIPVPPLAEQERIVKVLDEADALRKLRAEADRRTADLIPALFYEMFGDPVRNEKGWPDGTLDRFGASVRYGLGQPPKLDPEGVPMLRATNVKRGVISETDLIRVNRSAVPEMRSAFLEADDVLVVRSGAYTGDVARVGEQWAGAIAGYDLVISPGEQMSGHFLSWYLLSEYVQKRYFHGLKARAAQPHLNSQQVQQTPVFCPPFSMQREFARLVKLLRMLEARQSMSNNSLEGLLQALMNRAFGRSLV